MFFIVIIDDEVDVSSNEIAVIFKLADVLGRRGAGHCFARDKSCLRSSVVPIL